MAQPNAPGFGIDGWASARSRRAALPVPRRICRQPRRCRERSADTREAARRRFGQRAYRPARGEGARPPGVDRDAGIVPAHQARHDAAARGAGAASRPAREADLSPRIDALETQIGALTSHIEQLTRQMGALEAKLSAAPAAIAPPPSAEPRAGAAGRGAAAAIRTVHGVRRRAGQRAMPQNHLA